MMCRRVDTRVGLRRRRSPLQWLGVAMLALGLSGPWPGTVNVAIGAPRFEVVLEDGGPREEDRTLSAKAGDTVAIRFRSDQAVTLHLHGYDRELRVPAGGAATMRFDAAIPGRFPIELHGGYGTIVYLEILPD